MIDFQDLEDRIASLERTIRNIGIGQELVVGSLSILGEQLLFVRADKDSDGDYGPLEAAAWENVTKSGTGTINWNTVFGVPTGARMVKVVVYYSDDAVGTYFYMQATSGSSNASMEWYSTVADVWEVKQADIPVASDGTSYYDFSATFVGLYLRVIGWYI